MTIITKMGITPAEPLSHGTAKFAFEGNVLFSMLFAVS